MNLKFVHLKVQLVVAALASLVVSLPAGAAELTKPTLDAFTRYVQLTEARLNSELKPDGPYLYPDALPASQRAAEYARLKQGQTLIQHMGTRDAGKNIDVPDGMIHHWLGLMFIPGATLKQTLAVVQDYGNHQKYYAPDVQESRLISHKGNDYQIFYRLKRHKVVTVVLNTNYDVHYGSLSPARAFSRSYSTRIAEVADPGQKNEREKRVDDGTGFMWRLYSYWRFEERDGGTYVQCEAISLSRDIPAGLGWMIGSFVESVPRDSLQFTLEKTREALTKKLGR